MSGNLSEPTEMDIRQRVSGLSGSGTGRCGSAWDEREYLDAHAVQDF